MRGEPYRHFFHPLRTQISSCHLSICKRLTATRKWLLGFWLSAVHTTVCMCMPVARYLGRYFARVAVCKWVSEQFLNGTSAHNRPFQCYYMVSHAHTVVWECCKDDQQSQKEMLKFDPQLPLIKRSPPNLACVITSWISLTKKNWAQSVKGFLLPIYAKYTPPCSLRYATLYACLLLFLVLPIAYSRD